MDQREGSTICTHDCKRGSPKSEHDIFPINWAYGSLEAMKILEHTTSWFHRSLDTWKKDMNQPPGDLASVEATIRKCRRVDV